MTKEIVNVEKIGKSYSTYRSEMARFARWFGAPVKPTHEFWAVRDISFSLNQGESIALVGQNGAGKSTLLKLITGTIRPNEGHVSIFGNVSAILELGIGFNPEFTGRQNVFHSGGLLGLAHAQVEDLMPEIEEFAGIGEFIDQPIRVYSSGMVARLAFSLVTAIRPDVLVVDEILSVGDAYFQHKSFNRIRQFKEQGTTIILVTHSMSDVLEVCDRAILLDRGRAIKDGAPDEIVDYYNAMIAAKETSELTVEQRREHNGWMLSRSGTLEAVVSNMAIHDAQTGDEISTAQVGQRIKIRVEAAIDADLPRLVLGVMIRDRTGHVVWGTNTWHTKQIIENVKLGTRIIFEIDFDCTLGPGSYSASPALVSSDTHLENNYEWTDNMLVFNVVNFNKDFFIGTNYVDAQFTITQRLQ